MSTPSVLRVACAILERDGLVLAAQRPEGKAAAGAWEFPGGKIEPGEAPEAALIREIREELGCEIRIVAPLSPAATPYPQGFVIELHPFRCEILSGEPQALEHQAIRWLTREELPTLTWPEADVPVLAEYLERGNKATRQQGNE